MMLGSESAAWHSLRALCVGHTSAEFVVRPAGSRGTPSEGDSWRRLRLLAQPGAEWKDVDKSLQGGSFVRRETSVEQLTKLIVLQLQKHKVLTLHTWADSDGAVAVICQAIALAPSLGDGSPLKCVAASVRQDGEDTPRVLVRVHRAEGRGSSAGEFVAYPPGGNADDARRKVFFDSVRGRLTDGQTVVMECRGRDAAVNAINALGSVRFRNARCQVRWVDAYREGSDGGSGEDLLLCRARCTSVLEAVSRGTTSTH
eukprot:SRR837773.6942.p1 GENE.SRR837773.6942~~SRR837773.6942.p1  ORF type:complete len:257 (-),score=8.86 SRR837773.6942:328-1098(-)